MTAARERRVLLMQLSERTSGNGTRYLSGFLGKAKLVAFLGKEPDKFGNPVWNVYAAEPTPREGGGAVGREVVSTTGALTGTAQGQAGSVAAPLPSSIATLIGQPAGAEHLGVWGR